MIFNSAKAAAQFYYFEHGWSCMPTGRLTDRNEPKAPFLGAGEIIPLRSVALDADGINAFWSLFPNAGVSVLTGKLSNLSVIDVDFDKKVDGVPTADAKLVDHSDIPTNTLMARSGSGGLHFFFKHSPKADGRKELRPHIDLKSEGGYVILPPSIHKSGRQYEWINDLPIADFPEHLLDNRMASISQTGVQGAPVRSFWDKLVHGLAEGEGGGRNNYIASVAGMCFKNNVSVEDAILYLIPFGQSCKPAVDIETIERTVRSTYRTAMMKHLKPVDDSKIEVVDLWQAADEVSKEVGNKRYSLGLYGCSERPLTAPQGVFALEVDPISESLGGGMVLGDLGVISGHTGRGKCLGLGTPVIMFDGKIKKVEDIHVGDLLMGDDSTPRTVLSLTHGREEMFQVTQVRGEPYVVNKSHILSLRMGANLPGIGYKQGEVIDISITEYLGKSGWFRHLIKGYKVPVSFSRKKLQVDPYLLGYWLGDGSSGSFSITTADREVVDYLQEQVGREVGHRIRVQALPNNKASTYHFVRERVYPPKDSRNKSGYGDIQPIFLNYLKGLGVLNNKHIPHHYKTSSHAQRLQLLAGLIDSDGYLGDPNGFIFVNKNEILARDVCFVAQSLGFSSNVVSILKKDQHGIQGFYWRVGISGDCSVVPVKIARKRSTKRKQIKDVLNTGISLQSLGEGDYYGFEIDGNRRFLLGDFTVTHNTLLAQIITQGLVIQGEKTLWFEFELMPPEMRERFITLGVSRGTVFIPRDTETKSLDGSMEFVEAAIVKSQKEFGTRFVFLDLLDRFRPRNDKERKAVNVNLSSYLALIAEQLKDLAVKHRVVIILMAHTRKPPPGSNKQTPDLHDINNSGGVAQNADWVLMVHRYSRKELGIANKQVADGISHGTTSDEDAMSDVSKITLHKNRRTGKYASIEIGYDIVSGSITHDAGSLHQVERKEHKETLRAFDEKE